MQAANKIGYVLTHHPRDSQTFIQAEIDALRDRGAQVAVWAMNQPGPNDLATPEAKAEHARTSYLKTGAASKAIRAVRSAVSRNPGVLWSSWRLSTKTAGLNPSRLVTASVHWLEALILWDEARHAGVEQFHAHFGQTPSTLAMVAHHIAIKTGAGPQKWTATVHGPSEVADPSIARMDEKIRTAERIIAVSDFTRSQILRWIPPAAADRVEVVRCGIDIGRFSVRTPDADRHGIVFCGRVTQAKGLWPLLEAMETLAKDGIEQPLTIIGDGDLSAEAAEFARSRSLPIEFVGSQPSSVVGEYLSRASTFCLPSYDEGLPVAIMEAMAAGAAVVTTPVGGIPELAIDEVTALVVPPGRSDVLADALRRLNDDSGLRASLAAAAFDAVAARHNDQSTLPEFIRTVGAA